MSLLNNNLKQHLIQGLNQIPEPWALTPLLGWYFTPDSHNWQVLRGNSLSPSRQEFKTSIVIKVGATTNLDKVGQPCFEVVSGASQLICFEGCPTLSGFSLGGAV